ncbi:MAG: hypothetical protein KC656_17720 [Myxococcales bacterium]|nr:hypothetical protein [Myxococcales bacterium]MCB9672003.1 hypothetical protein [Alphaproteobacteria bacterium]MCB9692756.1 hypothetical protein [Alphaproteobacteria bacterium]
MEDVQTPMEYQISGVLMVVSGLFNLMISGIYVLGLIWVCVGVLWLIPMFVALAEIAVGAMALAGVRVPGLQVVSIMGMISSMFMCNIWGAMFEGIAAVLQFQPKVRGYLEG